MIMLEKTKILTAALLFLSALPGSAQESGKPWASKLFKESSTDLGVCPHGAQLKHRFEMTNNEELPLYFLGVHSSRGYVRCRPTTNRLRPGQTAYLDVFVDANRFEGSTSACVHVTVQAGDSSWKLSTATLKVQAKTK